MKALVILGTRPELIKLYPVIKELKPIVVNTGQHKEMLDEVNKTLKVKFDYELNAMSKTLTKLTARLHILIGRVLSVEKPDVVIVQGDTTTAMVAALEAFYLKIPVAHVEAGLRTDNIFAPFPEEANRRIITQVATYNFAPTDEASMAVFRDTGKFAEVMGNTVVDTLQELIKGEVKTKKKVLVTIHRRENFVNIPTILDRLQAFIYKYPDWEIVVPVHLNPNVQKAFKVKLPSQIKKVKPFSYIEMIRQMRESAFIITDSGGIQEEAPSLGKRVLVVREDTERPEGLGICSELVRPKELLEKMEELMDKKMTKIENPFGDGQAGRRIARFLCKELL